MRLIAKFTWTFLVVDYQHDAQPDRHDEDYKEMVGCPCLPIFAQDKFIAHDPPELVQTDFMLGKR